MDPIFKLVLLILLITCFLSSWLFYIFKNRIIHQILDLVSVGLFISYTSQYAYLFAHLGHLSVNSICYLLLFVFSIMLGVYKVFTFRK